MVEKKKTKKNLESIHHPVLNFLLPPERKESPPSLWIGMERTG
jgi:hypothetical protein